MGLKAGMRVLVKDWIELPEPEGDNQAESEAVAEELEILEISPNGEWVKVGWPDAKDRPLWEKREIIENAVIEQLPAAEKPVTKLVKGLLEGLLEGFLAGIELAEVISRADREPSQKSD